MRINWSEIIVFVLLFTGCNLTTPHVTDEAVTHTSSPSLTITPPDTDQPASTPLPSATLAPTSISSETPMATWTPVPLLTGLPPDVAEDFLLFDDRNPDCELPCWEGITPGKTVGSEAQVIFSERLHTPSSLSYELMGDDPYILQPFPTLDLRGKGYSWIIQDDPLIAVTIFAWYEEDEETIRGIEFKWISRTSYSLTQQINPQRLLYELGPPDRAYAVIQGTESGSVGVFKMLFLYDVGIVYTADIHVPIEWDGNNGTAHVCLGGEQWNGANNAGSHSVYLTEPFPKNEDDFSPFQWFVVTNPVSHYNLRAFEDFAAQPLDALAAMAQQSESVCLDIDLQF